MSRYGHYLGNEKFKGMITRDKYIAALDIVEKYHGQLRQISEQFKFKQISDLEIGDFVKCIYVNGNNSKCLTVNKVYEIIHFDLMFYGDKYFKKKFSIIDDKGKRKNYYCKNDFFEGVVSL